MATNARNAAKKSPGDLYKNMFTPQEKKFILDLAKRAIEYYFSAKGGSASGGKNKKLLKIISLREIPREGKKLKETLSCFVTLTIGGNLRGCMGHVEAVQPLYLDIMENAAAAAFDDPRFSPLSEEEYKKTEIEVSVLSKPEPLSFSSPEDLLKKLRPGIDGVILRRGRRGATYLPQVWENLPDKEQFLSSLCEKAGLPTDDWKKSGLEVETYEVEALR